MVVREQLGPGMGDQAVVAINNENPENEFFNPEYAQYAQYAVYNMQTICSVQYAIVFAILYAKYAQ